MGYSTSSGAIIKIGVDGAEASEKQIDRIGDSMNRLSATVQNAMKNLVATVGVGAGLSQIVQMSDEYTKFTAQLRLASNSNAEFTRSFDDVRRIATSAQVAIGGTGILYARIAKGTQELGIAQKRVAEITETVNLALKVSGATAAESASAQLQLSQAFASGALRGEEFNAVNEAAPRLMLALADGIGVPVGALKEMASKGLITSKVMAEVLPNALLQLREEAKHVQTISGAFTVLKDNAMLFTATQADANGTVKILTGGIGLLAENLNLVAGAMLTVTAVKMGTWLQVMAVDAAKASAANAALIASNVATAEANAVAAASAASLAAARVTELRAAVLAAEGNVALAITTNGLIPAEINATRTAAALTTANLALSAAQSAASITGRAMAATLAFVGGPVGLVIAALGIAATAWSVFGKSAKDGAEKAAVAVDESTTEMIARLDKQIAKLKERNALDAALPSLKGVGDADKDGLARAKAALEAARNGTGAYAGKSLESRQLAEIDLIYEYETALKRVTAAQEEAARSAGKTRDIKLKEWFNENGTKAQQMAAELDKLRKEFGTLPPEMEKLVRAKYEDKAANSAIASANKATLEVSLGELKAGITREKALREENLAQMTELNRQGLATDVDLHAAKVAAAFAAGDDVARVKAAEIAELRAYNAKDLAERIKTNGRIEALEAEKTEALRAAGVAAAQIRSQFKFDQDKPVRDDQKTTNDEIAGIYQQVAALELQNKTYGMLPASITAVAIATLEERKIALDAFRGADQVVEGINRRIAALKRLGAAQGTATALDKGSDLTKATELLAVVSALDDAAKSAASGMESSFGRIGKAIGGMTTALTGFSRLQAATAAQLAASIKDAAGDESKVAAARSRAAVQTAQSQISSYASVTNAAKGFFNENSAGYRALEGAEKAFRAVEMAMAVESMLTKSGLLASFTGLFVASKATETAATVASVAPDIAASMAKGAVAAAVGVANQAQGDPYTAWPRMAAMAAAMTALGFAVSGGGGGVDPAKARQDAAGKATVFGDASAKSDSIEKSIDLMTKNSGIELSHTAEMVSSLRTIARNISGLSNLVVRTSGIEAGKVAGVETGTKLSSTGVLIATGPIGLLAAQIPVVGNLLAKLFGSTTKVVDQGIAAISGSLQQIQQGGIQAQSYADIETTKKFLGITYSNKTNTQLSNLPQEIGDQFALVIKSIATGVTSAADVLGVGGDEFAKRLETFVVEIGAISIKGLTGDQIQKQFETIFSRLGDDIAKYGVAGLSEFQRVGEGYFETLNRVASNYANLDSVLQSIGATFGSTGLASIAARERFIDLAGGIDVLAQQTSSFAENFLTEAERLAPVTKYVVEQMASLGYASIDTRQEFKDLVLNLIALGDSSAVQVTKLLSLEEAFAKVYPPIEATASAAKSAADVMSERLDLQKQLDQLTLSSIELLERQRNSIDASNRSLYDQVVAAEKARDAAEAVKESAALLANTNASYQQQIDAIVKASLPLNAQRALEVAGMEASTLALYERLEQLKAEEAASKSAAEQKAAALVEQNTLLELQSQLYAIIGDEAAAATVLQKQHAAALLSMTPAVAAATQAVWDATASAKKQEGEAKAMAEAARQAEAAFASAVARAEASFSALSKSVSAEKAANQAAYDSKVKAIKERSDLDRKSLQEQSKFTASTATAIRNVYEKLKSSVQASENMSRETAQNILRSALGYASAGGSLENFENLDNALQVVARPSEALYRTFEDYKRDQIKTSNTISDLASIAGAQASVADMTLAAINSSIAAIDTTSAAEIATLALQHAVEVESLDGILAAGQASLEQLKGVDVTLQSVADAMLKLSTSIAEAAKVRPAAPSPIPTSSAPISSAPLPAAPGPSLAGDLSIQGLYQQGLGRAPDRAGLEFWTKDFGSIVDAAEAARFMLAAAPELAAKANGSWGQFLAGHGISLPSFDVGTNFVTRDMDARIHRGERILPEADNRELMARLSSPAANNAELLAEIRALRRDNNQMKTIIDDGLYAIALSTRTSADLAEKNDAIGIPPERVDA